MCLLKYCLGWMQRPQLWSSTRCQRLKTDVNHQHNKSWNFWYDNCSSMTFSLKLGCLIYFAYWIAKDIDEISLLSRLYSEAQNLSVLYACCGTAGPPICNLIYLIAPVHGLLINLPLTPCLENVDTQSKDWHCLYSGRSFWTSDDFHWTWHWQKIDKATSAIYNVHQMSCICCFWPQFSLSNMMIDDTKFDSTTLQYIFGTCGI